MGIACNDTFALEDEIVLSGDSLRRVNQLSATRGALIVAFSLLCDDSCVVRNLLLLLLRHMMLRMK